MTSKPHGVQLFLAPEIRSAIIKYMAKHDLDKEYACQQLIVKQLRTEQLLNVETYELYLNRYGRTVSKEAEPIKLSATQLQEKQKQDELTRMFRNVASQWTLDHKPQNLGGKYVSWKEYWITKANEHPENEGAQELLKKYVRPQQ